MIVRVYWNLHKKLWSIQTKTPKGWRVTAHLKALALHDCSFSVSAAGRSRVLKERRKNVHAFIVGNLRQSTPVRLSAHPSGRSVNYSPLRAAHFFLDGNTDNEVTRVQKTILRPTRQVEAHGDIECRLG